MASFFVTPVLQVKQKVSAVWSLGAIGISLAAVLIGGLDALRNSVSITPSLMRRWRVATSGDREKETMIELPIHSFARAPDKLREDMKGWEMMVRMLKKTVEDDSFVFSFIYKSTKGGISSLYTINRVVIVSAADGTYSTKLFINGDNESVKKSGGFMRRVCLDWSMNW